MDIGFLTMIYNFFINQNKPNHFITQKWGRVDFKAVKNYGFFERNGRLIIILVLYNENFVHIDDSMTKKINRDNVQKWLGYEKELPLYKIFEMDKRLDEQPILQEFINKLKQLKPISDEFLHDLEIEGKFIIDKYND
jgi:hypothetical protein